MKISVIVCAFNSENFIKNTLISLCNQTIPSLEYEILVVDNNSTDNTSRIVQSFIENHPSALIRYIFEAKSGLSHARNRGINDAKSDIIVFIDDDAEANPTFLEEHLYIYNKYPEVISAGGKVIGMYPDNVEPLWMSKYVQGIYSVCDYGDTIKPFPSKYPTGCNMSFRKDIIKSIGGFNTNIKYRSDEKYVFSKLKVKNNQIYYTPKAIAYHYIHAQRLEHEVIVKIAKIVGAGERERFINNPLKLFLKLIEYIFKLLASALIGIIFLLKGKSLKAKYLWLIRYHVIGGFFFYRN